MRNLLTKTLLVAVPVMALSVVPALASHQAKPAAHPSATTAAAPASSAKAGSHSISGVVKDVTATSLVITPKGKKGEMTFSLSPSTHREGTLAAGERVSVRYNQEGKTNVATGVTVQAQKKTSAKK